MGAMLEGARPAHAIDFYEIQIYVYQIRETVEATYGLGMTQNAIAKYRAMSAFLEVPYTAGDLSLLE